MIFGHLASLIRRSPRLFDLIQATIPCRSRWNKAERFLSALGEEYGSTIRFIQIGANDGMQWDPMRRFIVKWKWEGILVEPLPGIFELLKKNYRLARQGLVFANVAVSDGLDQELAFFTPSQRFLRQYHPDTQLYFLRQSSISESHIRDALERNGVVEIDSAIERILVPSMSVQQLIHRYWDGQNIELLVCDAEGHDARILCATDFSMVPVRYIVFEAHNLSAESAAAVTKHLRLHGFELDISGSDGLAWRRTL